MNTKTWTLFGEKIFGILFLFKTRLKLVETTDFV